MGHMSEFSKSMSKPNEKLTQFKDLDFPTPSFEKSNITCPIEFPGSSRRGHGTYVHLNYSESGSYNNSKKF